jgi:hypothetical protein
MGLQFGATFETELQKFNSVSNSEEFLSNVIPFVQFCIQCLETDHPYSNAIKQWKVKLFNRDGHMLHKHQVEAVIGALTGIVLCDEPRSGYCFMPTSAGKGHILMTLAGLGVGDFAVFKEAENARPDIDDIFKAYPGLDAVLISLSFKYSKLLCAPGKKSPRTQVLVHDTEILDQIANDCLDLLGRDLASRIEFKTVQAHRNQVHREALKYVIIDEAHWGNASEDEGTIQYQLIEHIKQGNGRAFGFTASPYEDKESKFQRAWSYNKINNNLDFNYFLDNKIVYPVTLREINLQNARVDFDGVEDHEVDLQEKEQVINFMSNQVKNILPMDDLDGPAICYFSNVIIPDMVEKLLEVCPFLKGRIRVLGSDDAKFVSVCREMFGNDIIARDRVEDAQGNVVEKGDIQRLKDGEKIFLISRQKLLVGLNAPLLRYCFISPTNSRITIMQAIGRLMRPSERVNKKLAVLFLTSLSGKRLDIGGRGGEDKPEANDDFEPHRPEDLDAPKTKYTTTSMTLSEAYNLPHRVFYKHEVGFRDFINEAHIRDGNLVEVLKTSRITKDQLEGIDAIAVRNQLARIRDICRTFYRDAVLKRDGYKCRGKDFVSDGCRRTDREVNLEIHHTQPEFHELFRTLGEDGAIAWHKGARGWEKLVTLCSECHDKVHAKKDVDEDAA